MNSIIISIMISNIILSFFWALSRSSLDAKAPKRLFLALALRWFFLRRHRRPPNALKCMSIPWSPTTNGGHHLHGLVGLALTLGFCVSLWPYCSLWVAALLKRQVHEQVLLKKRITLLSSLAGWNKDKRVSFGIWLPFRFLCLATLVPRRVHRKDTYFFFFFFY